jgi:hypothetical protein
MVNIRDIFDSLYANGGRHKRHCKQYKDFAEKWGNIKTLYEICDDDITKVEKATQIYLTTYLQFLCYMMDKGEAEEEEWKFQEQQRKLKNGRK